MTNIRGVFSLGPFGIPSGMSFDDQIDYMNAVNKSVASQQGAVKAQQEAWGKSVVSSKPKCEFQVHKDRDIKWLN